MISGIEVIFFDLDDTLVAFDLVTEVSWRQVCEEYAARNPNHPAEEVYEAINSESHWYWSDEERHRIGRNDVASTRRKIVMRAFEKHRFPVDHAAEVADRYSRLRLENMYIIPGAVKTLSTLFEQGVPLGLITNGDSDIQRYKVSRFGLGGYFKEILIEGEAGYGKPDRRIFELAISKFDTSPGQMLMVGDNLKWDVGGPQSVGMHGVWFDVKGKGLPEDSRIEPDAVITALPQVLDFLD